MSAGVLARELDMELIRVDLSRIVSKWVGDEDYEDYLDDPEPEG